MKIGFKVTLFMVALNAVSVAAVGSLLVLRAWRNSEDLTGSLTMARARQASEAYSNFLSDHWSKVGILAAALERFELIPEDGRRDFIDGALRGALESSPYAAAVWSVWGPDALDGGDGARIGAPGTDAQGRFAPEHARGAGGALSAGARTGFAGEDFYLLPRARGERILTNPYFARLASEARSVATISAPVRNSAGEIAAVVGIDIDLAQLNELGQSVERVFPGTLTAAFSNDGSVVSHFDPERIGRSMMDT